VAHPTVLYIGAHDVDFMIRAGGTMMNYARAGSRVVAVSLSDGERQESERLWRDNPGITLEEVAKRKRAEAERCAELVGCEFTCLGWADAPLAFGRDRLLELARIIQDVRPQILITHWPREETNWDHLDTGRAVQRAAHHASSAGTFTSTGLDAWVVPAIYYSEPWFPFPDKNGFHPNVWVDITGVYETKLEGLRIAWSHGRLDITYPMCAEFRGLQANLQAGDPAIRYAEAFVTETGWVGKSLPFDGSSGAGRTG
jgi:4-oxalomesaconate hydratase